MSPPEVARNTRQPAFSFKRKTVTRLQVLIQPQHEVKVSLEAARWIRQVPPQALSTRHSVKVFESRVEKNSILLTRNAVRFERVSPPERRLFAYLFVFYFVSFFSVSEFDIQLSAQTQRGSIGA